MQTVRDERAIMEGYGWNGIQPTARGGAPIVRDALILTYSFPLTLPEYWREDPQNVTPDLTPEFFDSFQPVAGQAAQTARAALDAWQKISNVSFVDVGPAAPADIVMGLFDFAESNFDSSVIGFGYLPGNTARKDTLHGDTYIDMDSAENVYIWLHELGHALGLSHPHEDDFILAGDLDNARNTVLSYNLAFGVDAPGPLDEEAITRLYGVAGEPDAKAVTSDLFGLRIFPQSATDLGAPPRESVIAGLRDQDGALYEADAQWRFVGGLDAGPADGVENVYMAQVEGAPRWATLFVSDGTADLDDVSAGAGSYVLPEYVDPLVPPGHRYNSQGRFEADTRSGNINGILGVGDYDGDGGQEIYFSLANGHAVLHMYMNDDRSFRYANYQSEQDLIDFMSANGVDASVYQGWL